MFRGDLFFLVRAVSLLRHSQPSGPAHRLCLAMLFLMLFPALLLVPHTPVLPSRDWSSCQGRSSPPLPNPGIPRGSRLGGERMESGPANPGL